MIIHLRQEVEASHYLDKRMSVRTPFIVAAGSAAATLVVVLSRLAVLYWDDSRVVDFVAAWFPFAVSILLAFIPDHRMRLGTRIVWRAAVIASGLMYSGVLWHQQGLAAIKAGEDQKNMVMKAVENANQHTDKSIEKANAHTDETVQEDLKRATAHSDEQVASVRTDLTAAVSLLSDLISKSANEATTAISKVGKPDPPERPKLIFSLWGDGKSSSFPLTLYPVRPDKDGAFPVEFDFVNRSGVAASKIDFWVYVCDDCVFFKEPAGFDKPTGLDEHARHRLVPGFLNPGTAFEKTTILVRPTRSVPGFEVGFRYSCKNCATLSDPQTVKIIALPPGQQLRFH